MVTSGVWFVCRGGWLQPPAGVRFAKIPAYKTAAQRADNHKLCKFGRYAQGGKGGFEQPFEFCAQTACGEKFHRNQNYGKVGHNGK